MSQNKIIASEIGLALFVRKGDEFFRITHITKFAQSTDAALTETNGFIAYQHTNAKFDVEASFITAPERAAFSDNHITDSNTDTTPFLPLYARGDNKLYQIAQLFIENPDDEAITVSEANALMSKQEGISLLGSVSTDEVGTIYIIARNEPNSGKLL